MAKTPFVWLGAGRAAKRGVAPAGVLLDRLARARLPVPQGAILLDELYQILLAEGVVEKKGERVYVPDPQWLWEVLYRDVRFPRLRATAVVSPIAEGEAGDPALDEFATSSVDLEDKQQLPRALGQAWSYAPSDEKARRDLLLITEVGAQNRGRALLNRSPAPDMVTVQGLDDDLVLPPLGRWERPSRELAPYLQRLQMLLRGVRRTLGPGARTIYWADDGDICWLAGAR